MNKKLIEERKRYVAECVNNSDRKTEEVVKELSKRLFLSERTIWRDLNTSDNTY